MNLFSRYLNMEVSRGQILFADSIVAKNETASVQVCRRSQFHKNAYLASHRLLLVRFWYSVSFQTPPDQRRLVDSTIQQNRPVTFLDVILGEIELTHKLIDVQLAVEDVFPLCAPVIALYKHK